MMTDTRNIEYFVALDNMLKYKKLSSNASHIRLRPAFSHHAEEIEVSWSEFFDNFKPLRAPAKANEGHA